MRFLLIFIIAVASGCRESITDTGLENRGRLLVNSNPQNARIFLKGENTGRKTPYEFFNLQPGEYSVSLKLTGYKDTTIIVQISLGQLNSLDVELNFVN